MKAELTNVDIYCDFQNSPTFLGITFHRILLRLLFCKVYLPFYILCSVLTDERENFLTNQLSKEALCRSIYFLINVTDKSNSALVKVNWT